MTVQIGDTQCEKISVYLKEKLNLLGKENHAFKFVNTIRNWDDKNIPATDFPCLKVYRQSDQYVNESYKVVSQLTIEYGVVVSPSYKFVPALNQIGKYIHTLLTMIDSYHDEIIISRAVTPSGRLQTTNGKNDYIFGWYVYNFAVDDQTIPDNLVQIIE